ncbi:MAG: sensor domain-containing protein [Chloroflexi bacterium]|nr:sensor domain-containing protein [Chloroflexota bacterium]
MIGPAALVVGLLLILTWALGARIPGEATFASPGSLIPPVDPSGATGSGRLRNPIRAFLLSPVHPATWAAGAAILAGFFIEVVGFGIVVGLFSAGASTLVFLIGIVFIGLAIEAARIVVRIERGRATWADPRPLNAHRYPPLRGGWREVLRAEFASESRWRDVLYVGVNLPLAIIEFAVIGGLWILTLALLTMPAWFGAAEADFVSRLGWFGGQSSAAAIAGFALGVVLLPVSASLAQLVMALHRAVVSGLVCSSESRELRRQVESLRESRSAVLDVEASELHRIERDLHDGAQQRLVMLTIDLGLASERMDEDPAAARQLILDGQAQAREALAEIRDLVRGIAPPILVDRGLVAAIQSIAGRGPVPTTLTSSLAAGERFPPATERAAYFVVTEALTNVSKHSAASRCEIRCRREDGRLVVEVWDDGAGGARLDPGGGLTGLASRIAGVDGTFSVSSPAGGPTVVRAEIPLGGGWAPASSP